MYYSININQIAIARHNNKYDTNFDLVDGAILEYLQKQSTSAFAKRNYKIFDGLVFYLLFYDNIIQQLPLIKIENKESIGRRIKKLVDANVILQKIEKIPNNGTKIYFTTTDIFETFFSYDTTQKSDGDTTQKLDGDTTQKSDELIYDKNIKNKNINDKINAASGLSQNENPTVNDSFTTQNPTVKESLTVQKQKKEEEVEAIPNCIDISKWEEWKNYKKEKKQKLTKSTAGKQLQNLQKWHLEGQDPNEIIDNSISNGWAGLFPLKQQKPTFNNQYAKSKLSMSESADLMRQMAQYTKEQQEQLNQKEYEYPF